MSNPLVPHIPPTERVGILCRRKLQRLAEDDAWLHRIKSTVEDEKISRELVDNLWADGFKRFAIPYVSSTIVHCFAYESDQRQKVLSEEKSVGFSLLRFVSSSLWLICDWDETREDIIVSERRACERLEFEGRNQKKMSAIQTMQRISLSYRCRRSVCDTYVQFVFSKRPKPQIVIPAVFWESFETATNALTTKQQSEWGALTHDFHLDCTYWTEVVTRRSLWMAQRLGRVEIEAACCLTAIGTQALLEHAKLLHDSASSFRDPSKIAAVPIIQKWWTSRHGRHHSSKGSMRMRLGSYREGVRRRLVEYHDMLTMMEGLVDSRPQDIPFESWELLTRLRALERGHELGAHSIWRDYVAGFNRLADCVLCLPKWKMQAATLPKSLNLNQTREEETQQARPSNASMIEAESSARTVLSAECKVVCWKERTFDTLAHSSHETLMSFIRWVRLEEALQRKSIEEEALIYLQTLRDAIFREMPDESQLGDVAKSYIERMLLWERESTRPAKKHVPVPPPRPLDVPVRLKEPLRGDILRHENKMRTAIVESYSTEREDMVMRYVWEAILGPNYWADHAAIVADEASQRRLIMISERYDAAQVCVCRFRHERDALQEEEQYKRRMYLKAFNSDRGALFAGFSNARPDGDAVLEHVQVSDGIDTEHILLNARRREEFVKQGQQIILQESHSRTLVVSEEEEAMPSMLQLLTLPFPFTCTVMSWRGVAELENAGRQAIISIDYTRSLSDIFLEVHRNFISQILFPTYHALFLNSIVNPYTSETRRLANTLTGTLTRFPLKLSLIQSAEESQRRAIAQLQTLAFNDLSGLAPHM